MRVSKNILATFCFQNCITSLCAEQFKNEGRYGNHTWNFLVRSNFKKSNERQDGLFCCIYI